MKEIKVKTLIKGDSFELSFEDDYTFYAKELISCNNVFSNTNEKMTEDNIINYFKPGIFSYEEIVANNGSHYLFGWFENFAQGSRVPDFLYNYEGELIFETILI